MIVRDARPSDVSAVHRLIGQLADAPDEAAFRARFERVLATDDHRVIVAEIEDEVVGVLRWRSPAKLSCRRWSSTARRAAAALARR
jgi:hypothetical protein